MMAIFEPPDAPDDYRDDEDKWLASKVCNRCGKSGLQWEEDSNGKWILYDSKTGEVHKCSKKSVVPISELLNQKI